MSNPEELPPMRSLTPDEEKRFRLHDIANKRSVTPTDIRASYPLIIPETLPQTRTVRLVTAIRNLLRRG